MAFARTPVLRLAAKKVERVDVSLAMRKWWNGFRPVNGLITKTLSPFEQKIIESIFEDLPRKVWSYVRRWSTQVLPALVVAYGTVRWADAEFETLLREHWD